MRGRSRRRIPGESLVECSSRQTPIFSYQARVTGELAGQPKEWLLKVVVGLGRDIVVLEVLLAVESDGLGLDLALLHVDLVAAEDDRNLLADADQVTVPVGNVLVGDARGDIKHDDTALAVDVVPITQTAELLLSCSVPDVEDNLAQVGGEAERVDLNTQGGNVLLLKFTSQMALDEGGLFDGVVSAFVWRVIVGLPPLFVACAFRSFDNQDGCCRAGSLPFQYRHRRPVQA